MTSPIQAIRAAEPDSFLADVLAGMDRPQKQVPCKYLYDGYGSVLFEEICQQPEYYLSRTELAILREHIGQMASLIGPNACVIELGSGYGSKTRVLLEHLRAPAAYVPVDVAADTLERLARELHRDFPGLVVRPQCTDFCSPFTLPADLPGDGRRVIYFPGSTIGNLTPLDALRTLRHLGRLCGCGGLLLIGVDLKKDEAILERAYNDAAGVTAAFNLNLLTRMNRELCATFDTDQFEHQAVYARLFGRIEMHLVSRCPQQVEIYDAPVHFEAGETIRTECSYKYAVEEFTALAMSAGLHPVKVWLDDDALFSVHMLLAV